MKWLVTGAKGMLGTDLVAVLHAAGQSGHRHRRRHRRHHRPGCRRRGGRGPRRGRQHGRLDGRRRRRGARVAGPTVNGEAARLLARAARTHGATLVQIGTDYVFDGSASTPYAEDARLSPASAYGRTKAEGEQAVREEHPDGHLIVRTAWLYGAHGACFRKTIAGLARDRDRSTSSTTRWASRPGRWTWPGCSSTWCSPRRLRGPTTRRPRASAAGFDFARTVVVAAWTGVLDGAADLQRGVRAARPATRLLRAGPRGAHRARAEPDRRLGGAVGGVRPRSARPAVLTRQARTADPWSSHHRAADRCHRGRPSEAAIRASPATRSSPARRAWPARGPTTPAPATPAPPGRRWG